MPILLEHAKRSPRDNLKRHLNAPGRSQSAINLKIPTEDLPRPPPFLWLAKHSPSNYGHKPKPTLWQEKLAEKKRI